MDQALEWVRPFHPVPFSAAEFGLETTSVLIADRHDAIRRGVKALLATRQDIDIVGEAATGPEARSLAEQFQPDIAIIGFQMPELNGVDLTRSLKLTCPHIKVLIYTGCERDDIVCDALGAGARSYISKRDRDTHLLAAIDALCVGRSYFSPTISESILDRLLEGGWQNEKSILTPREREIVQLIAEGAINKSIAYKLGLTVKTVESHRMSAMRKLNLKNTAGLVRWAIHHCLVEA
jgi:DNA-binding NarL/FixJ family response regulator